MDEFEEGQLSGPHGPKFVGHAEQRRRSIWPMALAMLIAALILMALL